MRFAAQSGLQMHLFTRVLGLFVHVWLMKDKSKHVRLLVWLHIIAASHLATSTFFSTF